MRLRHVVATFTATTAMTMLVIVGTAGSASAGIPGAARSNIVISELFDAFGNTYAFRICASGNADDGPTLEEGAWQFTVVGWRSNNTTILYHPAFAFGTSASFCYFLDKQRASADYGAATVNLAYVLGVGVDMATYATGEINWDPNNDGYLSTGL